MTASPQSLTAAALLCVFTVLVWRFVRKDREDYELFKAVSDSAERRAFYRRWLAVSLLTFGLGTLASLAILGRLSAVTTLPKEFAPLADPLGVLRDSGPALSPSFWAGFGGAVLVMGVLAVLSARLLRRKATAPFMLGDIQPLMPRNAAERTWTALLSINAGVSEELFFRLLLPLLLTTVTGNALFAFAASALIFGLIHLYQGWLGVVATTLLGLLLTRIYLMSGDLWVVMLIHAAIDLNGLVLVPLVRDLVGRRLAQAGS